MRVAEAADKMVERLGRYEVALLAESKAVPMVYGLAVLRVALSVV